MIIIDFPRHERVAAAADDMHATKTYLNNNIKYPFLVYIFILKVWHF